MPKDQKTQFLSSRDIVSIDSELCNGCGECLKGCAEGALTLRDGKAQLVSDSYCDGLGACLGMCPTGALKIVKREAEKFENPLESHSNCPGAQVRVLSATGKKESQKTSGLFNWPIQMKLVSPGSSFLNSPVLVVASDCAAYASSRFHETFLKSSPLVLGCPKLDDVDLYIIKLSEILKANPAIKEFQVPILEVPCCRGLIYAAVRAIERSGRKDVKPRLFVISLEGEITEEAPQGS
ncbi:MAG: 4Fe-4S ferredoxin [Deltaproteobacteria bacterium]|jgi:Fe-S-cluster-containing hydrogenase component 2|nr:4Fe-4S ferredoxin [Deltaproteobacteria bacterium]